MKDFPMYRVTNVGSVDFRRRYSADTMKSSLKIWAGIIVGIGILALLFQ